MKRLLFGRKYLEVVLKNENGSRDIRVVAKVKGLLYRLSMKVKMGTETRQLLGFWLLQPFHDVFTNGRQE